MQKELYNKSGKLSAYGLACGYVEKKQGKEKEKILFMEHSHYHVKSGKPGEFYHVWEVFERDQLTKARKFYNKIKIN